jgi:hypothetical protein
MDHTLPDTHEPSPTTAERALAVLVDREVRRSIKRRGDPRDANGLHRLRADVLRRVPDADIGMSLTVHGDLLVYLDGRDLRDLLPKIQLPEPGSAEEGRQLAAARADLRVGRALRLRISRRLPCRGPRRRESRPRVRRAGRSTRATRAGPRSSDDDEPEPDGERHRARRGRLEPNDGPDPTGGGGR